MKDFYHILIIIVCIVVSLLIGYLCGYHRAYKRGSKAGARQAVEWVAVALAEMGFQGQQLTNIMNLIAGHLRDIQERRLKETPSPEGGEQ